MKVAAVIPARYGSTRFPGKPLALICGKPMVQHVYERSMMAENVSEVVVATDDERIAEAVRGFGGSAVMTPPGISSGTERVGYVAADRDWDVVLNVQGDEPLIKPSLIDSLAELFSHDKDVKIGTVAARNESYTDFLDPNIVKVSVAKRGNALYFSRSPIPYSDNVSFQFFSHHIGLYCFRRGILSHLCSLGESHLAGRESLEQLKWMDYGYDIRVIEGKYEPVGVDLPEDLVLVQKLMEKEAGEQ